MHHGLVRKVGIAEDHLVDLELLDQTLEAVLEIDGDALGIQSPGQLRWILAALYAGYLRRSEGDDLITVVIPVHHVEVVKVTPGRAQQQHSDSIAV
jgi:hypothetical protein